MTDIDRTNPIISAQLRNMRWAIAAELHSARRKLDDEELEVAAREWLELNLDVSWKGDTRQWLIDEVVRDMVGPDIA